MFGAKHMRTHTTGFQVLIAPMDAVNSAVTSRSPFFSCLLGESIGQAFGYAKSASLHC